MDYKHFIITQFNLRNFPNSDTTSYERWIEWTHDRIILFRKYCLPSIQNQTVKSFSWLLFFDIDTPSKFDFFLQELKSYDFIIVCYCKGFDGFQVNYMKEVKSRIPTTCKWAVTTRIDNDDCLHRNAVKTIQQHIIFKHNYLISLASGYILNISENTLSHYFYPMSPFITIIENVDMDYKGIFEMGHTKWGNLKLFVLRELWHEFFSRESRKARFILKKPMWIQLYHGGNVSNTFYRGIPVLGKRNLNEYSLDLITTGQASIRILKYINYVTWKRYFKSLVVKIIIGK